MPLTPSPHLCEHCPNWSKFREESVSQRLRAVAELVLDIIREAKSDDEKEVIEAIYAEIHERIKVFDLG